MRVLIWLADTTADGCVEAARPLLPADADITVLAVVDDELAEAAHAAFSGLLGRRHAREDDPGDELGALSTVRAQRLLAEAAESLGGSLPTLLLHSPRPEREVVEVARDFDLLVCARDGASRVGPHSFGPTVRFVVDHACCPVLLVWAEPPSDVQVPPLPQHRRHGPGEPPPPPPPGGHPAPPER